MAKVWIQSVHNLHCPMCDARLVQRGRRCAVPEQGAARYVGEVGTLACPSGHPLPDRPVLYAYRDGRGHAGSAPVQEVPAPRRAGGQIAAG